MAEIVQSKPTYVAFFEPPQDSIRVRVTIIRIRELAADNQRFIAVAKSIAAIVITAFDIIGYGGKALTDFVVLWIMAEPYNAFVELRSGMSNSAHSFKIAILLTFCAVLGLFTPRTFIKFLPDLRGQPSIEELKKSKLEAEIPEDQKTVEKGRLKKELEKSLEELTQKVTQVRNTLIRLDVEKKALKNSNTDAELLQLRLKQLPELELKYERLTKSYNCKTDELRRIENQIPFLRLKQEGLKQANIKAADELKRTKNHISALQTKRNDAFRYAKVAEQHLRVTKQEAAILSMEYSTLKHNVQMLRERAQRQK